MRRPFKSKRKLLHPDIKYQSPLVSQFINYIMKDGKKSVAQKIVYSAFEKAQKKLDKPAIAIFEQAIENTAPILEVRSKRIGGATYQVPSEVRPSRKISLAFRWIIESARKVKGKNMDDALSSEIVDAYNKVGASIKKREDTHKAAEANKAFAHFARF